jgi:uncharacterized membrane protein YvbJ
MANRDSDWFTCPVCGEQVRGDALACPSCGSDDETGWSEDTAYDGMDLPIDDEWPVNRGPAKRRKAITLAVVVLMAGLIVLLLLAR